MGFKWDLMGDIKVHGWYIGDTWVIIYWHYDSQKKKHIGGKNDSWYIIYYHNYHCYTLWWTNKKQLKMAQSK